MSSADTPPMIVVEGDARDGGQREGAAGQQEIVGHTGSASDGDLIGRAAVALFGFDGEGPELAFAGGASLTIYDEVEVGRGWALGQHADHIGLVPLGFFVFVDAVAPPSTPVLQQQSSPPQSFVPRRMSVDQARTPELVRAPPTLPISTDFSSGHQYIPQRPAPEPAITVQRPSQVLKAIKAHGRTWQSAGASLWVLEGAAEDCAEEDRLHIDVGSVPAWREIDTAFDVLVHSARVRADSVTIYTVTTYHVDQNPHSVERRYSHWIPLDAVLRRQFSGLGLPELPPKRMPLLRTSGFNDSRQRDLQRYLSRITRHPVVRNQPVVRAFLELDEEKYAASIPELVRQAGLSSAMFSRVFHDDLFGDDLDAAEAEVSAFREFAGRVERGGIVREIDAALASYRDASTAHSDALRAVGRSLWSVCGAEACWRPDCDRCRMLRASLQSVAESVATVSATTEVSVGALLHPQELAREIAAPRTHARGILDTVDAALSTLKAADGDDLAEADAERTGRVETVLAGALAEINRMHDERVVDLTRLAGDFLDAEIAAHQESLRLLLLARDQLDGTVQPPASSPDLPAALRRSSDKPAQPSNWRQAGSARPLSSLMPW